MPVQGAPTPWWQLPGMGGAKTNLDNSAGPGKYYDPDTFSNRSIVGSPQNQLEMQQRQKQMEDQRFQQEQQFNQLNYQEQQRNFDTNQETARQLQQHNQQQYGFDQQNQQNKQRFQQQLSDSLRNLGNLYSGGGGGSSSTSSIGTIAGPRSGGPTATPSPVTGPTPSYVNLDASNAAQN